jgi:hypothetical protein
MVSGKVDYQSKFVIALQTQASVEYPLSAALPCPFCEGHAHMFQSVDILYDHAKTEHASQMATFEPGQAREKLRVAALKLR